MVKLCNTCGSDYDERVEGVRYSSSTRGVTLFFCSDKCCQNYLNRSSEEVKV